VESNSSEWHFQFLLFVQVSKWRTVALFLARFVSAGVGVSSFATRLLIRRRRMVVVCGKRANDNAALGWFCDCATCKWCPSVHAKHSISIVRSCRSIAIRSAHGFPVCDFDDRHFYSSRQSFSMGTARARLVLRYLGLVTYPFYLIHNLVGAGITRLLIEAGLSSLLAVSLTLGGLLYICWLFCWVLEPIIQNLLRLGLVYFERTIMRRRAFAIFHER
jgi:hypothetical protein